MAFLLPRDPLTPTRTLEAHVQPGERVLRASEFAMLADAEAMLAHASAKADAIIADAKTAFEQECQRGYAEGIAKAKMVQAEEMIETVVKTVDYLAQVEQEMVALVTSAVKKIVGDLNDEQRILAVVKNALSVVRNQKQMTLRLHPSQIESVQNHVNELLSAYPGVGYLDIIPDGRLQRDACILESDIGMVEASIEGQVAALENAFRKILGNRV